jgi:uncharacterized membrane protein
MYDLFKAMHVASLLAWIGGTLTMAVVVRSQIRSGLLEPQIRQLFIVLQRWDQRVTVPAMLLAWTFGLAMAVNGHWWGGRWFLVKLVLAVLVAGAQGVLSGCLGKALANGPSPQGPILRWAPLGLLVATTAIAFLVILKPF